MGKVNFAINHSYYKFYSINLCPIMCFGNEMVKRHGWWLLLGPGIEYRHGTHETAGKRNEHFGEHNVHHQKDEDIAEDVRSEHQCIADGVHALAPVGRVEVFHEALDGDAIAVGTMPKSIGPLAIGHWTHGQVDLNAVYWPTEFFALK